MSELSDHRDALNLFAPAAYHYYLPAFIRATLLDPHTAGAIPDTIVFTIELEFGIASRGTLDLFSPPQRAVLAQFLRGLAALNLVEQERLTTFAELLEG